MTSIDMQVLISSGPSDSKRAILGLSLAASAASAGTRVNVYFVMDGTQILEPGQCERALVDGFPSPSELIEMISALGGSIEYCPNCASTRGPNCATPIAVAKERACACAGAAGIASYGVRMSQVPTVVF